MKKYKLSICMIVRDEEKFIDKCLNSMKPLVDSGIAELIVVDTGSVDNTVEIVKKYTDKVFFKEWNNSFSEARNYSISLASGEYIFIMDADQEMEPSEVKKIIDLFSSNEYKKYNTYSLIYKNFTDENLKDYVLFSLNLIFRNDGTFRYEGVVHNQPVYKGPIKDLEVYMLHYGYIMTDDIKDKKFKRTATLLKQEIEKDPENVYYIYQLSRSYEMHGDTEEAVAEVEKYLSLIEKEEIDDNLRINYYHNAAIVYFNANMYEKCIYYCDKMKKIDKELIDSYYLTGKCKMIMGDYDAALISLKNYLKYLKSFKYEKYAKTNGLEVFSFAYKEQVIQELFRLKVKIKQYENIDTFIKFFLNESTEFMLAADDILNASVMTGNVKLIDDVISKLKEEDEVLVLLYLLSVHLSKVETGKVDELIGKIKELNDDEKQVLKARVEKEKLNSFENLMIYIEDNIKDNKTLKIESCISNMTRAFCLANIDDITKSKYIDDIQYIIEYLLVKSQMIINYYFIDKELVLDLLKQYEAIVIYKGKSDGVSTNIDFVKCIDGYEENMNNQKYIKAVEYLKEAIKIKPEFVDLVMTLINSMVVYNDLNNSNLISQDEVYKVKENLVVLINNGMVSEAFELITQLESLIDIRRDAELISIKGMLHYYMNNYDEAEKVLKQGLIYYKNDFDIVYNLSCVYEENGKILSALYILNEALENNKNINNEYVLDSIARLNGKAPTI